MANEPMVIEQPLVIMFEADGGVVCHIHPSRTANSHEHYGGPLICDLVRHVARAFKADDAEVWKGIDQEHRNPTTDLQRGS